jgi:TPP-dependent pyruvate/acetoin dehydrogenase alpha subunit
MYEAAGEAVARARRGGGPSLLEVETYRFFGHFQGDPEVYRPKDEVKRLKANDPISRFANQILDRGLATQRELDVAKEAAAQAVDEAIDFARKSPYPDLEEAREHVFV